MMVSNHDVAHGSPWGSSWVPMGFHGIAFFFKGTTWEGYPRKLWKVTWEGSRPTFWGPGGSPWVPARKIVGIPQFISQNRWKPRLYFPMSFCISRKVVGK